MSNPGPPVDKLQELDRDLRTLKATIDEKILRDSLKFKQLETTVEVLKKIDEEKKLNEDVAELERRVNQLKSMLNPQKGRMKKFGEFLLTYWTLIAFCSTAIIAAYVYYTYGVGYFESYKNISDTKRSADYYKQIGDALLPRAEFRAAEDAYKSALEINPNYVEARQALIKTQILKPLEGYNTFTPVVVEAKLNYLQRQPPSPNDYLIPYFRGVLEMDQDNQQEARKLFQDSLSKQPEFAGNYIQLGYLDLFCGSIDSAATNFRNALTKVPNHPLVLNYLGMCDLVSLNFQGAINQLERAVAVSPRLETLLNLGEAYRNAGDGDTAAFKHEMALELLNDPKLKEGVSYELGTFNFMPTVKQRDAVKIYVQVSRLDQYKSLIYYALSIDYALQRKFSEASKAFDQGYKSDQTINGEKEFGCFYLNRLEFITNGQKVRRDVVAWAAKKRLRLDPNNTCQSPENYHEPKHSGPC